MRKSRGQETVSPAPRASERRASSPEAGTKYPRPKILVIDAPDVTPVLQQRGYAAVSGSFGQPVVVPPAGGYRPLNRTADLPGYTEQEIIVADLAGPDPQRPAGQPTEPPGPGVRSIWVPTARGLIDPRPAAMLGVHDAMDRIYRHGGVFILFAAGRFDPEYIVAERDHYGKLSPRSSQRVNADRFARSADAPVLIKGSPAWAIPAAWDDPVIGGPQAPLQLYGGDLRGVEERLDYLHELGVNVVYLTPFFPAPSNHRYDATTFDHVDPLLGGDAALASLSAALHRRGMRLLGDLTTNHSGSTTRARQS